ncbi:MAG: response regulator [Prevotella sp.]|nr:response regulator [Prevotella sp.]
MKNVRLVLKRLFFVGWLMLACPPLLADSGHLYRSDKLPSSLVNCSRQDQYGYIWVATDYGLSRFDGYRFINYFHDRQDSTTIDDNIICSLCVDSKGRLWIGSSKGLMRYDYPSGHFIRYHFIDPRGFKPRVYSIIETKRGDILAGTIGYGLFKVNEGSTTLSLLQGYSSRQADMYYRELYEDANGDLWRLDHTETFTRYSLSGGKTLIKDYHSPYGPPVKFLPYDESRMLIACKKGFLFYDYSSKELSQADFGMKVYNGPAMVNSAVIDHQGNLYVGTADNGIMRDWNRSLQLVQLGNENADGFNLVTSTVNDIMEDRSHNLWISCYKKGLYLLNQRDPSFLNWSISGQDYSTGSSVSSIVAGDDNKTWCAVPNDGLYTFNRWGGINGHPASPAGTSYIYRDRQGVFWVTTSHELYRYYPDTETSVKALDVEGGEIYCMTDDGRGRLYLSVYSKGLYIYNKENGNTTVVEMGRNYHRGHLCNAWIRSLLCDSHGKVWIGTAAGLNCLDPDAMDFQVYGKEAFLTDHQVNALCEQSDGNIAIGTEEGLYLFDRQTKALKPYPNCEKLNDLLICGIVCDPRSRLWISTTKGLWQYDPHKQSLTNYVNGDGLITHEYVQGTVLHKADGLIAFGTSQGLTAFYPDQVTTQAQPLGDVHLTNLTVEGVSMFCEGNTIHIPHDDNTFTLEFSLLDYKNADHIQFLYNVNGSGWISTEEGVNAITFNNLEPGTYKIEVRAESNGALSEHTSVYTVIVDHPWYSTRWAYLVYLLLLAGLCYAVYQYLKRRRHQEMEEEKMRFLINATHDIRSPLTLILGPLNKLKESVEDAHSQVYIDTIDRNAQRLLLLVNQILDEHKIDKNMMHLHCRETDLVAFITGIKVLYQFNAAQRGITYSFIHTDPKLLVWIDRTNFDKVISNLLSNAFKYVPDNGEVRIELSKTDKEAVVRVTDSGQGFKERDTSRLFERFYQGENSSHTHVMGTGIGLNLCRAIVHLHHGDIKAYNREDDIQGACVEVRLPLGNNHLKSEEIELETVEEIKTPGNRSDRHLHILVVDDDREVASYIRDELSSWYQIDISPNGKEALAVLLKGHYDLVISDVIMPEMDGVTLLKKIKGNPQINHLPVILLTSKADVSDRLEGLREGADAFLAKPFHMEELHVLIDKLIDNLRRLRGKFSGALGQEERRENVEVKSFNDELMERIMKSVNAHLADSDFNVERLADDVGISRAQLHRKMKEITGVSTGDFIRNQRLEQAARLIREKKVNLTQVAYSVGFSNQSHFSTVFKKHFGRSPSEYANSEE